VYDQGEGNAAPALSGLNTSIGMTVANRTNGLLVVWEHRFYGESAPPITDPSVWEPENLAKYYKFLDVEQALEDVVQFASHFTYKGLDLSPRNTPWIFLGASYPGARAAWIRDRNPETIYISLAESAVVQTDVQFPEYGRTITDFLVNNNRQNCVSDLAALAQWMGQVVANKRADQYESLVTAFANGNHAVAKMLSESTARDPWEAAKDNLEVPIDILEGDYQDVGLDGTWLASFCDGLEAIGAMKINNSDILKKHGIVAALGFLEALPIIEEVMASFLAAYSSDSTTVVKIVPRLRLHRNKNTFKSHNNNTSAKFPTDDQSWSYQYCTEMGFFQVAPVFDPNNIEPPFDNYGYEVGKCMRNFGTSVSAGPSSAPLRKYGGFRGVNPSNTFWVDGRNDPWRNVSPGSPRSWRNASGIIPDAGKTLEGNNYFGAIVNGSFHAPISACIAIVPPGEDRIHHLASAELNAGVGYCGVEVLAAQQLFLDALGEWLPKFQNHSHVIVTATEKRPRKSAANRNGAGILRPPRGLRRLWAIFVLAVVFCCP
jgi:hypothetical protein